MSEQVPRLLPAYYSAYVNEFIRADPDAIYGALSRHHAHSQEMAQRVAWLEQIMLLQKGLSAVPNAWLAFEFAIPRMGKRADAVVILDGVIFFVEFKVHATAFDAAAIEQVTDYALDLKNFHSNSHSRILIPAVIATERRRGQSSWICLLAMWRSLSYPMGTILLSCWWWRLEDTEMNCQFLPKTG
jgi:hypothetical protein